MRAPSLSRLNNIIPLPDNCVGFIIGGGVGGTVGAALVLASGGPVSTAASYLTIGVVGGATMATLGPRIHSWVRAALAGGAVGACGGAVALLLSGDVGSLVGSTGGTAAGGCMLWLLVRRRSQDRSPTVE